MSSYFQAIAVDFDGTITELGRPSVRTLAALSEVRAAGVKTLLVTGRVVTDLMHVFPDAEQWFDVIVAENGAVIRRDGVSHALTGPVPLELDEPLVAQGVYFQRGQVLLACSGEDELTVLREVRRLEADCQLVRNRAALMVLPSEVSKGWGLTEALKGLGVSYHSTIGIGDAENDLSLFRHCELGVAVGNAVESLKREADIVLSGSDGVAVADFLQNQLLVEESLPPSRRWRVTLGLLDDGSGVSLPASRVNILLVGGSGVGKSYAAGLLAERLIELDYSVCFIDPEGDHAPLGRLPKVLTVGGRGLLPEARDVPKLISQQLGSLIVDLSFLAEAERTPYTAELLRALREERSNSCLPHWILIDEAHMPFAEGGETCRVLGGQKGLCLVTYDATRLCRSSGLEFDFLVAIPGQEGLHPAAAESIRELSGIDPFREFSDPKPGEAWLVRLDSPPRAERFRLGRRFVQHVRHWHKYAEARLPPARVFRFRSFSGPSGAQADNLSAFRRELLLCDSKVLQHHAANHDFSHWLEHAISDETLARVAHELEKRSAVDASFEDLRRGLVEAIEDRYLG